MFWFFALGFIAGGYAVHRFPSIPDKVASVYWWIRKFVWR